MLAAGKFEIGSGGDGIFTTAYERGDSGQEMRRQSKKTCLLTTKRTICLTLVDFLGKKKEFDTFLHGRRDQREKKMNKLVN